MRKAGYYELFDAGKKICRETAEEIAGKLGCSRYTVMAYAMNGKVFRGRYTFKKLGNPLVDKPGKQVRAWAKERGAEWDKAREQALEGLKRRGGVSNAEGRV